MLDLFSLLKKKPPEIYIKISNESENFLFLDFNRKMILDDLEELLEVGLKPVSNGEFGYGMNAFFVIFEKLPNYDQSKLQDLLTEWLSNG